MAQSVADQILQALGKDLITQTVLIPCEDRPFPECQQVVKLAVQKGYDWLEFLDVKYQTMEEINRDPILQKIAKKQKQARREKYQRELEAEGEEYTEEELAKYEEEIDGFYVAIVNFSSLK